MTVTIRQIAAVIAVGVPLACAAVAFAQDAAPAGDAKRGQQTYMAVGCWECHGSVGQGGDTDGPRLAAIAGSYSSFLQQLRVPRSEMPPYEAKILPDSDVANIYAYVRSIRQSKAAKDIPLLNALK
jgi:mono/diheme cytochrome c family protein